jgi:segregation and condensation protein B
MSEETIRYSDYQQKIEAILFAAGYPVSYDKLAEVLELTPGAVKKIVQAQAQCYHDEATHGIELLAYDTACQLCTKAEHEEIIKKALGIKKGAGTLSNSSLEVLAIIAYHQPVTRAYIEQIRGVDSSYHVGSLTDKGLIEPKGRLDVPGKPILFGTTKDFLRAFGIASLSELPSLDLFASVEGPQQQTFDIEGAEQSAPQGEAQE